MTSVPEATISGWGSVRNFRLTSQQRQRLRAALKSVRDASVVKRIIALLELDRGVSPADIAARLGVTRQTLHNWMHRFDAGGGLHALYGRAGRGYVTTWSGWELRGSRRCRRRRRS